MKQETTTPATILGGVGIQLQRSADTLESLESNELSGTQWAKILTATDSIRKANAQIDEVYLELSIKS